MGRPPAGAVDPPAARTTIVVVTHNGAAHIGPCLRSLIASGADPLQVIVVDNASTDETVDVARREIPNLRIVQTGRNLGYGGGVNLAARHSAGEFLAVLNQDAASGPGWVDRLVGALDDDPTAAIASPKVLLNHDPSRVNACGNTPHYTGITTCRGYGRASKDFTKLETVPAVSGAAFVVRRAVFEELGGFDPLFFMYLEDTDFSLRAALAGFHCLCVPEATVLHDFEPSFPLAKIFWLECNRALLLLRLYRARTLLLLAPPILVTELLVLSYCLARGPGHLLAKLRAYVWLASHLGMIRRSRRRTQGLRRVPDRRLLETCATRLDLGELDHRFARHGGLVANSFYAAWSRLLRRVVSW